MLIGKLWIKTFFNSLKRSVQLDNLKFWWSWIYFLFAFSWNFHGSKVLKITLRFNSRELSHNKIILKILITCYKDHLVVVQDKAKKTSFLWYEQRLTHIYKYINSSVSQLFIWQFACMYVTFKC